MKIIKTEIPDLLIVEPAVFGDARGFFIESFHGIKWNQATGQSPIFVQDNHSRSSRGVLRGLHYQIQQPQGKLVRVVSGEIYDVAVDIRKSSPTFGRYSAAILSDTNHRMLWVPPGFAHGFLVLSEICDVIYKTTDYYAPQYERAIAWNDPAIGIPWPLKGITPILSAKDKTGKPLAEAEVYK
jgi:dTDP-4-dehydrorhamnose 3,5-epimerase